MVLGMAAGQRIHEVATDSTKGSFGNRAECAGAQIKNDATSYLKAAGVLGTMGAVGYGYANKVPVFTKVANNFAKYTGKALKAISQKISNKPISESFAKVASKVGKNPRAALAGTLGAIGLAFLGKIAQDHAYKSGQIDQKYTDKAAVQKQIV